MQQFITDFANSQWLRRKTYRHIYVCCHILSFTIIQPNVYQHDLFYMYYKYQRPEYENRKIISDS